MKTTLCLHHYLAAAFLIAFAASGIARDRFEYDPTPKPSEKPRAPSTVSHASALLPPGIKAVIAAGETREVLNSATAPGMALYVPEMNPSIVQVVIQKGWFKKPVYCVRGIRPGTATCGIVPRAFLDKSGFRPNNITDAARVQAALKAHPITITVR